MNRGAVMRSLIYVFPKPATLNIFHTIYINLYNHPEVDRIWNKSISHFPKRLSISESTFDYDMFLVGVQRSPASPMHGAATENPPLNKDRKDL